MRLSSSARSRALATVGVAVLAVTAVAWPTWHRAAAATPPAFVQAVTTHQAGKASVAVTPAAALGTGNRLVVEVGIWSSANATANTVTDAAGDAFTKLLSFTAADHTEMSIWSAPVTAGAGKNPAITAKATGSADVGVVALEYSGLSTAVGAGAMDTSAHGSGLTTMVSSVASGETAPVTAGNEIALGFYADSGFGNALGAGTGFTSRANVSPAGDMEMLVEDQAVGAGATPNAGFGTGAKTTWLAATVVFQSSVPSVPGAPTAVTASPADGSVNLSWTAPGSGGSPITGYLITPFVGTVAQTQATVPASPTAYSIGALTNGTIYTFAIAAINAVGVGPAALSSPVTPAKSTPGSFSPLQTWPIMTVATHLMYNGEVVTWDGWQQPQPSVTWNPATPTTFATVNAPDSVFCDGAADLPDGRLLVVGGYGGLSTGQIGIVDTTIFDPTTNTWSRVANMHDPRWYPTLTELADGRYVAISGNSTNDKTWADTPEVYNPATNTWTRLTNVDTSSVHEVEYPFSYLAPNGEVFVMGPEEDNSHLLDVNAQTWTSTGASGLFNGSSVMYRPGRILYSGGAALINTPSAAKNSTAVIDLTAATPSWRQTAPMSQKRIYHTLTMLADGTVLAVGGANTSDQSVITTGVLPTEIWNPDTETWSPAASLAAARNYHSTAILLPDGRVLVSGGGHPTGLQDAAQYSAQFFSPSYLSAGPRPTISSVPAASTYGSTMAVGTPDAASITAVNLVSLGADTHQIDMNQHFVPLSFTARAGGLDVQAPASGAIAPPGYYMLFVLANGVPSVASIVHLGSAQTQTAPGAPANVTAVAGLASAKVNWTAPASGGSPVTGYTVTPFAAGVAQPATTIAGNPPATSSTLTGLVNGTSYTFSVTATNAVGTGPAGTSNAVTPSAAPPAAFVQQAGTRGAGVASVGATLPSPVTAGDRLIAEVGVWNSAHATTSKVSDSAGNTYTKIATKVASDGTEMTIWTAPVTVGAGARPSLTATTTSAADVSVIAAEYSGLSPAAGSSAVDALATSTGTTGAAVTVGSGATAAASGPGELAVGFYADSGFGNTIGAGSGWTGRGNTSPAPDMEIAAEDAAVAAGASANATFSTGAGTPWLAATVVFKSGSAPPPTVPGTVPNVTAAAGNGSATVSWGIPANGGSAITGYTVTPYLNGVAQSPLPAAASATKLVVGGLTNGQGYNFTVTVANAVGSGPPSSLSPTVVPTAAPAPTFVQQVAAQVAGQTTATVTPAAALGAGDRLVVEVGTWSATNAKTIKVADSAGDAFTELLHFTASDGTELSVWSAPLTTGAGVRPTITATASGKADIGIAASEYSGISATSPVDMTATATGTTTSAQSVSSGPAMQTSGPNELAIGFYADSGFGHALTGDSGYSVRSNVSPNADMDLLTEDAVVSAGAMPAPSIATGANTVWLAATIEFVGG